MSERSVFLAADLGASSGRVMAGRFDGERLSLEEAHRFPNAPVQRDGSYRWDVEAIFREIKTGLGRAAEQYGADVVSVGVDSWGVDYGLLDGDDKLVGLPFAYRDARTQGMQAEAFKLMPEEDIYAVTGIQFMDFNTVFQLLAEVAGDQAELRRAERLLFTPDLMHFWLTGRKVNEYTIASTGQLLDARKRQWANGLIERMGIPPRLFGEIVPPGTRVGRLLPDLGKETGLSGCEVVAPGAHDTASAVAAVPFEGEGNAYLSSGTWSLMGIETREPILTAKSAAYGFTNEGGVCGSIRVLKNICGLWLVQECRRVWAEEGDDLDFGALTQRAAEAPPFAAVIDPDDPVFASPGDMPQRMADYCEKTGQTAPTTKGSIIRTALESLAFRYREVIEMLEDLAGHRIEVLHMVGGGVQNKLLNQFAADAVDRKVVVGPVEATSAGSILIQMKAAGQIASLDEGREVIRRSFETEVYEPHNSTEWSRGYARFKQIVGR